MRAPAALPAVGVDRLESLSAKHMVSHTMEMMLACLSIIWDGVCERFPKVRIGFMESGGGWNRAVARPHGPSL